MSQVIVRNLDSQVKAALKERARQHGRSMEEEVRQILRRAVNEEPAEPTGLGSRIAHRFKAMGLKEALPELRGQAIEPMALDSAPNR